MKKIVSVVIICLLAMALFAGCALPGINVPKEAKEAEEAKQATDANESKEAAPDPAAVKTMGEAYEFRSDADMWTMDEERIVYVFESEGTYYRVTANLDEELFTKLWDLDDFDPLHDDKMFEIINDLPIEKLENLSERIPPQEELDKLVGKNVQELVDEGWTFAGWDAGSMEFWMNYGPFEYVVTCEGELPDPDGFDEDQANLLTVKSVKYDGIGNGTEM